MYFQEKKMYLKCKEGIVSCNFILSLVLNHKLTIESNMSFVSL